MKSFLFHANEAIHRALQIERNISSTLAVIQNCCNCLMKFCLFCLSPVWRGIYCYMLFLKLNYGCNLTSMRKTDSSARQPTLLNCKEMLFYVIALFKNLLLVFFLLFWLPPLFSYWSTAQSLIITNQYYAFCVSTFVSFLSFYDVKVTFHQRQ